jgi:hypothetical protein
MKEKENTISASFHLSALIVTSPFCVLLVHKASTRSSKRNFGVQERFLKCAHLRFYGIVAHCSSPNAHVSILDSPRSRLSTGSFVVIIEKYLRPRATVESNSVGLESEGSEWICKAILTRCWLMKLTS